MRSHTNRVAPRPPLPRMLPPHAHPPPRAQANMPPKLDYRVEEASTEPLWPALEKMLALIFDRLDDDKDGKLGKEDMKKLGNGVEGARIANAEILQAQVKKGATG
jgi:hypothetical protein